MSIVNTRDPNNIWAFPHPSHTARLSSVKRKRYSSIRDVAQHYNASILLDDDEPPVGPVLSVGSEGETLAVKISDYGCKYEFFVDNNPGTFAESQT